ncbi:MAG: asparagine synthase-related protein [Candidatus Acidiferrales bacterium]
MSGIVGMFERSGAPVDRGLLQALAHFLSYRGPDARETWSNGSIGLGHTMLRTTRGSQVERQPANLGGRLWITADARIDCREELKSKLAELESGKSSGPTVTDSDLILRSYAAWGADCVQHLRGDFAFAIWDVPRKLLFCARDHFGIKPFYYSEMGELFLFSNTLDCVRQHPEVSSELNDAAIGDFLLFGLNCDVATTTFRDIRRLPPAHFMTVSSEGLRIHRYWSAPTEGRIRYQRPEDYVEHFQILLQAAVSDRMATDRTGILLSGGLDSGTVAATARELSTGPGGAPDLRAYTVVYESLFQDEEGAYAQDTADFLNIPMRFIALDHVQPFERWDDPYRSVPEPVDDPCFAGLFDQFQAISADCRVVLSGEGNDSLMHFEMWAYVQDMIRNREWQRLLVDGSRYAWLRPSVLPGIWRRAKGLFKHNATSPECPRWLAPDFARRLNLRERVKEWNRLPLDTPPHPVRPAAYVSLSPSYWCRMFELENAGVTHCPVEVRHPFFDLRIVNYLLALPPFPAFFEKSLLRDAVAGRLPERIRTRRKSPLAGDPVLAHFAQPEAPWMRDLVWAEEFESYIDKSILAQFGNDTFSAKAETDVRPLCLNFWLQSARRVRYNLRAEVRNG